MNFYQIWTRRLSKSIEQLSSSIGWRVMVLQGSAKTVAPVPPKENYPVLLDIATDNPPGT